MTMRTNTQCLECSRTFSIEPEDFDFYSRIDVPAPTLCPDCRQQRRLAWRNERTLYARTCDKCQANIISNYDPASPYTVYCHTCWWSDDWSALDYGQPVDFTRPFYDQIGELLQRVPLLASVVVNCENSEFTNYSHENKNCYMSFDLGGNENIYYSRTVYKSRDCYDCIALKDNCELCYQCVNCSGCYNCVACIDCDNVRDSMFSFDCSSSANLAFCFNLRNAEYCIDNKQYTKEDYEAKLAEFRTGGSKEYAELKKRFFAKKREQIHRYAKITASEQSTGDHLQHCFNVKHSFNADNAENAKFAYDNVGGKDFYDDNFSGWAESLFYETLGIARPNRSTFLISCSNPVDVACSIFAQSTKNSFGAVATKNAQYVILNTQYTKEEYKVLRAKVIEHMKTTEEWGEFFPATLSPFAYNETIAQDVCPLEQSEVESRGWRWKMLNTLANSDVVSADKLPNDIELVKDDVIQQPVSCVTCHKAFRIIPQELAFYRQRNIGLPHTCPNCRHAELRSWINPHQLWQRQCMCTQPTHSHGAKQCSIEFDTTYAPERQELVYCERCYQKEVY